MAESQELRAFFAIESRAARQGEKQNMKPSESGHFTLKIAVMESGAVAFFCWLCFLAFFLESCRCFFAFLPMTNQCARLCLFVDIFCVY